MGRVRAPFKNFALFGTTSYCILCIVYTVYPFIGFYSTYVWHNDKLIHFYQVLDVLFARPLWAFCKFPIYILFLARLHFTFKNTYYSVDKKYYVVLLVLMFAEMVILIFCNLGLIIPFVNPNIQDYSKLYTFWLNIFTIMLLCDIIVDALIGIIFTALFVSKLKQMTQNNIETAIIENKIVDNTFDEYLMSSSEKQLDINKRNAEYINKKHEKIVGVMTKFTILCIVSMISGWICGLVAGIRTYINVNHREDCPWGSDCYISLRMTGDFLIAFDSLINIMCFYLSFAVQEKIYLCLCLKFHQSCSHRFEQNIKQKTILKIKKDLYHIPFQNKTTILNEESKSFEVASG